MSSIGEETLTLMVGPTAAYPRFRRASPGTFIPGLARRVGPSGKVIAIDLQEEMLELSRKKSQSAGIADRVQFHKCSEKSLTISVQADFVLTF